MKKQIKEVTVILSTYNGSKYIKEQLESLASQKEVAINLIVRDDGSKDDTVKIVLSFSNKFKSVKCIEGCNLGATLSFYEAANIALNSPVTEYYAFCDQDDIWNFNKLNIAITKLEKFSSGVPALYFSNLMMVNDKYEKLGLLLNNSAVSNKRKNALAAIYTYGCTCVFNRKALEKFCNIGKRRKYIFHDNWIYAVTVFMGNVYYDNNAYIMYRQTGNNVSGNKKKGIKLWRQRIMKIFQKENVHLYEEIAKELLECFENELEDRDIKYLEQIATYRKSKKNKLKLLMSNRMKTADIQKNICIKGRILTNKL